MSWTIKQLLAHKKYRQLTSVPSENNGAHATIKSENVYRIEKKPEPMPDEVRKAGFFVFEVVGEVVGKPRMTQRDKWQRRSVVIRYRNYCDRLRAAAPSWLNDVDAYRMSVIAHLDASPSWSKKKKALMVGTAHRQKPDADNIYKSVSDALFVEDSVIFDQRCRKFWTAEGTERTVVKVWFK